MGLKPIKTAQRTPESPVDGNGAPDHRRRAEDPRGPADPAEARVREVLPRDRAAGSGAQAHHGQGAVPAHRGSARAQHGAALPALGTARASGHVLALLDPDPGGDRARDLPPRHPAAGQASQRRPIDRPSRRVLDAAGRGDVRADLVGVAAVLGLHVRAHPVHYAPTSRITQSRSEVALALSIKGRVVEILEEQSAGIIAQQAERG